MPIYLNNKSYTLAIGNTPIEKMGGDNMVTYSMYGEEPPMKEETGGYELWGYGYDVNGNMGSGEVGETFVGLKKIADNIQDISTTYSNNLIYVKNNKVYVVGGAAISELNLSTNTLCKPQLIYDGKDIRKICTTAYGSFFVLDEDRLYVRGENIQASKYPMGLGGKTSPNEFTLVADDVINVASSSHGTMCIKSNGDIYYTGGETKWGMSATSTFTKYMSSSGCDEIIPIGTSEFGCYKKGETSMRCFGLNRYYTFSSSSTSTVYSGTKVSGIIPAGGDIQYTGNGANTTARPGFRILDKLTGKFLYSGYFSQKVVDSYAKPMGTYATGVTCICDHLFRDNCQYYIQSGRLKQVGLNADTPVSTSVIESQTGGKIIKLCASWFNPAVSTGVSIIDRTCAFFLVEK